MSHNWLFLMRKVEKEVKLALQVSGLGNGYGNTNPIKRPEVNSC